MNKASLFAKSWKEKWYGFWWQEEKVLGKPFDIDEHIDSNWKPHDFNSIVEYLKSNPCAIAGQQPQKKCGLCDELLPSAAYNSDGIWLWPADLSHLVEKHDFTLPDRFVEHMRGRHFRIAEIPEIGDVQKLPWP